jgi:hypothetical protein
MPAKVSLSFSYNRSALCDSLATNQKRATRPSQRFVWLIAAALPRPDRSDRRRVDETMSRCDFADLYGNT